MPPALMVSVLVPPTLTGPAAPAAKLTPRTAKSCPRVVGSATVLSLKYTSVRASGTVWRGTVSGKFWAKLVAWFAETVFHWRSCPPVQNAVPKASASYQVVAITL